jgi:preprotein translocase subunit SecA
VEVLLKRAAPAREKARLILGEPAIKDIERRIMLLSIDECWSEHLERVSNLQESIHLASVGGLDPLIEFQKQAAVSFDQALKFIDERVVEKFTSLEIVSGICNLEQMGLRGPSSTWTYLVADDAQTDRLASMLISQRHIGFAANAALLAPVLVVLYLGKRLLGRWNRQ